MFESAAEILREIDPNCAVEVTNTNQIRLVPKVLFPDEFNQYWVSINFVENYYRAEVSVKPTATQLVQSIRRGYQKNSLPVDQTIDQLSKSGWEAEIDFVNGFKIQAINVTLPFRSPDFDSEEVTKEVVEVGLLLNRLCLNYLKVTTIKRDPYVSAISRDVITPFDSEPWEFDPSERDRQTIGHRKLENWLIERLNSYNIEPLDPGQGIDSVNFDLAWKPSSDSIVVCEVKTTSNNETKQIRLGVGQVLHYMVQMEKRHESVIAALLVQTLPDNSSLIELARRSNVVMFSPESDTLPDELLPLK